MGMDAYSQLGLPLEEQADMTPEVPEPEETKKEEEGANG